MKATLKFGACLASLLFAAHSAQGTTTTPSFEDYREPLIRLKSEAKPKIVSSQDREFKTRVIEASKQSVNFGGHYVLSSFGCGASCIMSFALNKKSGKVSWLPFTVCCSDSVETGAEPIVFKKDSRLVVVTGSRNEQGKGVYYYELKQGQFVLLHEIER